MADVANKVIAKLRAEMAELRAEVKQLRRENRRLRRENDSLRGEVERLRLENRQLQRQVDDARRIEARQAAPFRRDDRAKIPPERKKRPGRKAGHPGCCRAVPDHIDHTVEVPLECCPRCGGALCDRHRVEQIIEEIPPVRPHVVKLITYQARCARCGRVRSTHPLQTSLGQGVAKVQLGPRALALAALLNKVHGLTMRKTCRVLHAMSGLHLSAGGLAQAVARVAGRVKGYYQGLIQQIRGSPAVFADETSWWVGGPGWWLWTFSAADTTVYTVNDSRGSDVVTEVLGEDFAGMLVSDCLASYNPASCRKHKCIAHHLRAIKAAGKLPGNEDAGYREDWKNLFHAVITLYNLRPDIEAKQFTASRAHLEVRIDELLARPLEQSGDMRIHYRLNRQRPHLLGCLYEPAAEPTNNRAERSLRPAVIARKLSCGNKTPAGRDTWQILTSLGVTCAQRSVDFTNFLTANLHLPVVSG